MAGSVVNDIQKLLPRSLGNRPWWERHAQTHGKLLAEILEAWREGKFGAKRKPACRAISQYLTSQGIPIGPQGVDAWLARNQQSAK